MNVEKRREISQNRYETYHSSVILLFDVLSIGRRVHDSHAIGIIRLNLCSSASSGLCSVSTVLV
jgi:hypothetical protein